MCRARSESAHQEFPELCYAYAKLIKMRVCVAFNSKIHFMYLSQIGNVGRLCLLPPSVHLAPVHANCEFVCCSFKVHFLSPVSKTDDRSNDPWTNEQSVE